MSNLTEKTKKTATETKRLEALDRLAIIMRLTDERYFDQLLNALETKDKKKFLEICEKLGIDGKMRTKIWDELLRIPLVERDLW